MLSCWFGGWASHVLPFHLVAEDADLLDLQFDGVAMLEVFLPGPERAWASLVRGFTVGDLWEKVVGTLEHMAYGWLAASIAGIALGAWR